MQKPRKPGLAHIDPVGSRENLGLLDYAHHMGKALLADALLQLRLAFFEERLAEHLGGIAAAFLPHRLTLLSVQTMLAYVIAHTRHSEVSD